MAQNGLPTTTRCLVLRKTQDTPEQPLNETTIQEKPLPALTPGHVLVRVMAAGFNHREVRFSLSFSHSLTQLLAHSYGKRKKCIQVSRTARL